MPLTFVEGSTAEVVFERRLGLTEIGGLMFTSGGLGRVDRTLDFRYGDGSAFMHRGPLEVYEGAGESRVELWEGPRGGLEGAHLVYRFGDWFVGVSNDRLTKAETRAWARDLRGRQTREGFLVLQATAPLVLQEAGEHGGPEILLQAEGGDPFIRFFPGTCEPDPFEGEQARTMPDGVMVSFSRIGKEGFADWCEDGAMRIQVDYATREYAEAAAQGLRVRNVELAET